MPSSSARCRAVSGSEKKLHGGVRLALSLAPEDVRAIPPLDGANVLLVDDGLATGSTMRAAVRAVRKMQPQQIVVAPVAAAETCSQLADEADHVVCLVTPEPFHAVGLWYEDFAQTSDDEVRTLLDACAGTPAAR